MKYCEQCRHFKPAMDHKGRAQAKFALCALAVQGNYQLIAADLGNYHFCNVARCDGQPCGPEAKLFESEADHLAAIRERTREELANGDGLDDAPEADDDISEPGAMR